MVEDLVLVRMVKQEDGKVTRWRTVVLIAAACGVLSACNGSEPTLAKAAEPANTPAPATSTPKAVSAGDFQTSGPLVVENQVDVAAQREGIVSSVLVDVGSHVRRGQLLAELDNRQLISNRDAAADKVRAIEADGKNWAAQLDIDKADLARAEAMWKADLITKEQVEHARAKVVSSKYEVEREVQNAQTARDSLRSIELELEKTRIVAPFNGVVARRYIRLGQKVAVSDRMFWVTEVKPINVRFTLPEEFVGKIRVGDRVQVFAPSSPSEVHSAKVTLLSPVVDPSSGTIEVQARLGDTSGDLLPGMTVNVLVKRAQ
ncbi:MAG TPA: efflux RND transporter periplasmic adaptor subunit [Terriglobales bacterium]